MLTTQQIFPLLIIFLSFLRLGYSENSRANTVDASGSGEILAFGINGKRNMLYDSRQRPQSVLLYGRVYIVYNGDASATTNGKGNAYPTFISYDPQSRKFSEPVRIGPKSTDHHYSPVIWADESDYLHVLHGCHRTPGTHLVSSNPVAAGVPGVLWHP